MPVLTVNDQQFTIPSGQTRLGGGADSDVRVGDDSAGIQAVIELGSDGRAVIRRGEGAAVVRVNGVTLGVEPTPLIHGDKVDIGGKELTFSDDVAGGATEFVSADQVAALIQKRGGPARATAATGGRLVSLVDGKEYAVPEAGITIGRDASAGVVVPQREVSRIHAEILPAGNGYLIHDRSTNGLYVNGTRVQGSQLLSRADVIRAGTEEFRFYADVASAGGKPEAPARSQTPVLPNIALDMVPMEAETARAAEPKLAPTMAQPSTPRAPATPAAPPAPNPAEVDRRPSLAVVEIIAEGPSKGTTFDIRTPLAHVGRGAHNDIVLADDSVSDSHAKIQRRDDGWYVVDLASTNGTYVGGTRIIAERRLDGSPDLRFGGIKTIFRPKDQGVSEGSGTRAIAAFRAPERPAPRSSTVAPQPSAAQASTPAAPAAKSGGGMPAWVWIVIGVVVVGGVAVVLLNR